MHAGFHSAPGLPIDGGVPVMGGMAGTGRSMKESWRLCWVGRKEETEKRWVLCGADTKTDGKITKIFMRTCCPCQLRSNLFPP